MLWSLSHTCQQLRIVALPLLWKTVYIAKVETLGQMYLLLDVSPGIAQHIRTFCFDWKLEPDNDRLDLALYPAEEGTMLDLAFRDRFQLWEEYKKRHGCEGKVNILRTDIDSDTANLYFTNEDGLWFEAPGHCVAEPDVEHTLECYLARRVGGSGPDGEGEDRLIKTAAQFRGCIIETVARLSLTRFEWTSWVTPLPVAAFNLVRANSDLNILQLRFTVYRDNVSDRKCA